MDFWTFWDQHWFLAWCALWLGWAVAWAVVSAISIIGRLCNRILRTLKVCFRGWPPEHLDADGDWKPSITHAEANKNHKP